MYVLLTQDVPRVGQKNALVDVSKGYFMNFLEPRRLARVATPSLIEELKDQIVQQQKSREMAAKTAHEQASVLKNASVRLQAKASDKGTLFKALTETDVAVAVKNQLNLDLDPSHLDMKHLKKLGEHQVKVTFGDEKGTLKVLVEAEES